MNILNDFIVFMEDYTTFFEDMTESEKDKLEAMLSNDIKRLEQSVSLQQAISKKLENIERKRLDMQEKAGLKGMSLKEIIAVAPVEYAQRFQELFERINRAIEEIKFYNDKSMGVVKMNLQSIDALNSSGPEIQGYTSLRGQVGEYKTTTTFEAKI